MAVLDAEQGNAVALVCRFLLATGVFALGNSSDAFLLLRAREGFGVGEGERVEADREGALGLVRHGRTMPRRGERVL